MAAAPSLLPRALGVTPSWSLPGLRSWSPSKAIRNWSCERYPVGAAAQPGDYGIAWARGDELVFQRCALTEIERLFGYEREELMGRSIDILVPARLRGGHPGYRAEFFGGPRARAVGGGRELFGVRKDGSEVPVEIGLNPIETEEGLFVLSSIVDVSARRKAHTALRESEERFRLIVESIQDYSIIMLDPRGQLPEPW